MGKLLTILIVSLSVIVGIIAASMMGRSKDAAKSSAMAFQRTCARNISLSAAEYYVRQLNANNSLRGTFTVSPILSGSAQVMLADWTYGVTDSIKLTSFGTYNAAQETVVVKLMQGSANPILNSALSCRTSSLGFTESGTLSIDGHNHDINNNLLAPSSNDRSGSSAFNSTDFSTLSGIPQIVGSPNVILDLAIPDPTTFAGGLISKADYTLSGSYSGPQTWGSASSPKIVYCNGDVKFTQQCNGWGILLINGSKFESTNKFTFTGIVIIYSGDKVEWKTSNTMTVIGGLLLAAPNQTKYNSTGQAYISYSSAALSLAKTLFTGCGKLRVANWSN